MGLLLPGLGSAAFQRTLFVGPQWSGALSSGATPFPRGPRNCGQSPARTVRDNSKASAAAVNIRRFMFKARRPNLTIRPAMARLSEFIYRFWQARIPRANPLSKSFVRTKGYRDF